MARRKTFPLKFEDNFSEKINWFVFHMKSESKQQYIIDAIRDKMEKDEIALRKKGIIYDETLGI
ncbi:hypothetical protein [Paenibacillus sp. Mc5Re-14]|uniref:hypothetical protein n=1 Tax=Paenibacillus sp. Mc5Re-14 TaxID=1030529 RepID=UPI000A4E2B60|nr:hypothetical protein [Paenibacillus sp. Mc5Re-14]